MSCELNPNDLSPALWAYLGDALYEVYIREYLIATGKKRTTGVLHQEAIRLVRAEAQARIVRSIEDRLSEEEHDILRRSRNYKTGHIPAHTDPLTYRLSTAWEGLLGYLYLTGREDRMKELISSGVEILEGGAE